MFVLAIISWKVLKGLKLKLVHLSLSLSHTLSFSLSLSLPFPLPLNPSKPSKQEHIIEAITIIIRITCVHVWHKPTNRLIYNKSVFYKINIHEHIAHSLSSQSIYLTNLFSFPIYLPSQLFTFPRHLPFRLIYIPSHFIYFPNVFTFPNLFTFPMYLPSQFIYLSNLFTVPIYLPSQSIYLPN